MLVLEAEKRDTNKNVVKMRQDGIIPAVFYGKKQKSIPITVPISEFTKAWKIAGESSVVTLKMGADSFDCLIYAVDLDPIKNIPRHADFYVFEKGQKLKVKVPIEFVGVSPAIKDLGGVLVKVLHELEIEASPKDLPHRIEVDISALVDFKSQILAKNVKLPAGVGLAIGAEEVVASVYEPKEEKIEEVAVAPDLSTIEVEKKGKKEEEGAEGATPAGEAKPAKGGEKVGGAPQVEKKDKKQ